MKRENSYTGSHPKEWNANVRFGSEADIAESPNRSVKDRNAFEQKGALCRPRKSECAIGCTQLYRNPARGGMLASFSTQLRHHSFLETFAQIANLR